MIDIIIPITNKKDDIQLTLMSIVNQEIEHDITITIINNHKDPNLDKIIKLYRKFITINYIESDRKKITLLKQYAISNTSNPYLMFINPKDTLFDAITLHKLYNEVKDKDFVASTEWKFEDKYTAIDYDTTNGKIYRRDFLTTNKIKYTKSDNYFNSLCILSNAKIGIINDITYNTKEKADNTLSAKKIDEFISNINSALEQTKEITSKEHLNFYLKMIFINLIKKYNCYTKENQKLLKESIEKYLPKYKVLIDYPENLSEKIKELL